MALSGVHEPPPRRKPPCLSGWLPYSSLSLSSSVSSSLKVIVSSWVPYHMALVLCRMPLPAHHPLPYLSPSPDCGILEEKAPYLRAPPECRKAPKLLPPTLLPAFTPTSPPPGLLISAEVAHVRLHTHQPSDISYHASLPCSQPMAQAFVPDSTV